MAGQFTLNPLSLAPNSYAPSTDLVTLFRKSIKQEPKDFPVIKLLNQWDSTKHAVNAMATVQSIAEVLNHTYIPSAGDKPLFDLKNSYWYKVLVDIIQESSLQAIVNAGPVGDGQTVWTNIVTEAEKSMTARISLQSLTAYLTTSKI
jgi:predicted O-linked N-acetylglucosamine transferase (SPINDLY family)